MAKFVSSEMTIARISQPRSALVIVSHSSCGLPTWLSRAKTAISVPIAIIRLVPLTRWSSWSGGSSVPAAAAAAARTDATSFERSLRCLAIGAQVAAERGGLEVGERLDDRVVAEPGAGGGDGAVVADEQRGAHEQLGDVGGAAPGGGGAGGELEVGDADRAAVDDHVVAR